MNSLNPVFNLNNPLKILLLIHVTLAFSSTFHLNPNDRSYIDIRNEICKTKNQILFYNVAPIILTQYLYYSDYQNVSQTQDFKDKDIIFGVYPVITISNKYHTKANSILQLNIRNNLTIFNSMKIDNMLDSDSLYIGKSWRGFTGYTESGYLNFFA